MGETAENVVERYGSDRDVTRQRQDAFALRSHQRAVAAIDAGPFDDQIVAVPVPQKKGDPIVVTRDEHPRADTSMEALAKLRGAFREGGSVTAGHSSRMKQGAAAPPGTSSASTDAAAPPLVVEANRAREVGLAPLARVVSTAVAGVDPAIMG